jgi:hypothetical protein
MWYLYTVEYYAAIREMKSCPLQQQRELKITLFSDDKHHTISRTWNVRKAIKLIPQKSGEAWWVPEAGGEGGEGWGEADRWLLSYIETRCSAQQGDCYR